MYNRIPQISTRFRLFSTVPTSVTPTKPKVMIKGSPETKAWMDYIRSKSGARSFPKGSPEAIAHMAALREKKNKAKTGEIDSKIWDNLVLNPDGTMSKGTFNETTNPNGVSVVVERFAKTLVAVRPLVPIISHVGDITKVVVHGALKLQYYALSPDNTYQKVGRAVSLKAGGILNIATGKTFSVVYDSAARVVTLQQGKYGFNVVK